MTVVSKQTLLDYFSSGGRATNPTSTGEWEFEDLIDTLFDVEDQVDVLGDKIDGFDPTQGGGAGESWADVARGYNNTDASYIDMTTGGPVAWKAPANKLSTFYSFFTTRVGFVGTITIYMVCWIPATGHRVMLAQSGDRWEMNVGGANGSSTSYGGGSTLYVSGSSNTVYTVEPVSFTSNGETWIIRHTGGRNGTHASDTSGSDVGIHGFYIVYS